MKVLRAWWFRTLLLTILDLEIIAAAAFYHLTHHGLPRIPDDLEALSAEAGVRIFAAGGELIYTVNRSVGRVSLADVSPDFIHAVLATEDARFYRHRGVSLDAVVAAVVDNIRDLGRGRGGSTITQQIVKNLFLSRERAFTRKAKEALLAIQLEAMFHRLYGEGYKDRILELYINGGFYGTNAYGVEDAARTYFDKRAKDLSLSEAAFLAALPNAPSAFSPDAEDSLSVARARNRTRHVLHRMAAEGYISPARLDSALSAVAVPPGRRRIQNRTPYFVETIKAEVVRAWGRPFLSFGALDIHTTLDLYAQRAAEAAVDSGLADLDRKLGYKPYGEAPPGARDRYVQCALVALDHSTGGVRAMVGGRDIFVSYYNRVTTSRRQPGSGFKPVVYLTALESGLVSPVSLFIDEPHTYTINRRPWSPKNFKDEYLGLTTAAWAFVNSANATAVQIVYQVGADRVAKMGKRLGIDSRLAPYPAIALGASEVTPLELASAYGVIGNYGFRLTPTFISHIVDRATGRVLYRHVPDPSPVVDAAVASVVIRLMENVVDHGTGRSIRRAGLTGPIAGKTGTTNDNTDAWFTGFTPELVACVWIGFDDRSTGRLIEKRTRLQITGGSGAALIWADFMRRVSRPDAPPFFIPENVTERRIDPVTGLKASGPDPADSLLSTSISVLLPQGVSPNTPARVSTFLRTHRARDLAREP